MTDDYKPAPKFVRTEGVYSLLTPVPALASVIFSVTGYIFILAGDDNGAKTFFVISLFAAVLTTILAIIAILTPRKKKVMPFFMILIAVVASGIIFTIDPNILQNLDFWSAPGEVMGDRPFIP
jgi:glucose uptake protein GlcU